MPKYEFKRSLTNYISSTYVEFGESFGTGKKAHPFNSML